MTGRHSTGRALDWVDSGHPKPWPPRVARHRVLEPRALDHAPGMGYAESVAVTAAAIEQASREARERLRLERQGRDE